MAPSPLPDDLGERLTDANRALRSERFLPAKLDALAGFIERIVPECAAVSIGLVVEGRAGTGAASSDVAIEADLAQYRTGDGPCLTAVEHTSTIRIDFMSHDERFPHFAPLALDAGINSSLSIPLVHSDTVVGSLNLYATKPSAFEDQPSASLDDIVAYTAELIARSPLYGFTLHLLDGLVAAVADHDAIAVASGYLMVSNSCDETTAMTLLRRAAEVENQSLADAARAILSSDPKTS